MNIVCLDMEGVLVPEIWIAFAEESWRVTPSTPPFMKCGARRGWTRRCWKTSFR